MSRLIGVQYVRLAPGAAQAVAPYAGAAPDQIEELVLDLRVWPEEIHPTPMRTRDGWHVAGDPILVDACDEGLVFWRGLGSRPNRDDGVFVSWSEVRDMQVLGT